MKKYLLTAAILISCSIIWYFYGNIKKPMPQPIQPTPIKPEISVDDLRSNKAVWRLSPGEDLRLDKVQNGIIGNANGFSVVKNDSELVFKPLNPLSDSSASSTGSKHPFQLPNQTMLVETLRGGYYRLSLPDGSKVVLNSASSIQFDSTFGQSTRNIILTGEAYFDVIPDPKRPFYVKTQDLMIELEDSKFNITAYKNENVVTTSLAKGSAKMHAGSQVVQLKEGEQAILNQHNLKKKKINFEELEKSIDWKLGTFIFVNTSIKDIIQELSRSYDVDVQFKGTIPKRTFDGLFHRTDPLSTILIALQDRLKIRIELRDNKIILFS